MPGPCPSCPESRLSLCFIQLFIRLTANFPPNYLTPPTALWEGGRVGWGRRRTFTVFCWHFRSCIASASGCGCPFDIFTFPSLHLKLRLCRPLTHREATLSPLGEEIAAEPFAAHHVVMETGPTWPHSWTVFLLLCRSFLCCNERHELTVCGGLLVLITVQHWFIYTFQASIFWKLYFKSNNGQYRQ